MTADLVTDEVEVEEVEEVEDLADIALAHPAERKRLDFGRINARELLSLGDVEDMARELGTDPSRLQSVLARGGDAIALDVGIVLAWIIGRKADPDLSLDHVRRYWQVEFVGLGTANPAHPPKARATTSRSPGRGGSSRKRA